MLEVGAQAFGFESGPDGELGDGIGLRGPDGELVGVEGEFGLEAADDGAVVEEEDL